LAEAESAEERAKRIAAQWVKDDAAADTAAEVCIGAAASLQPLPRLQLHPSTWPWVWVHAQDAPAVEAAAESAPAPEGGPEEALPAAPVATGSTPPSVRGKAHIGTLPVAYTCHVTATSTQQTVRLCTMQACWRPGWRACWPSCAEAAPALSPVTRRR
jgi:hypothetical protein